MISRFISLNSIEKIVIRNQLVSPALPAQNEQLKVCHNEIKSYLNLHAFIIKLHISIFIFSPVVVESFERYLEIIDLEKKLMKGFDPIVELLPAINCGTHLHVIFESASFVISREKHNLAATLVGVN